MSYENNEISVIGAYKLYKNDLKDSLGL